MQVGSKHLGRAIWVALLGLGVGQVAQAAEPGFYFGVTGGRSDYDVKPSEGIFVQISGPFEGGIFRVLPESTQVDDDGLSWNAMVGYRIHTYVAAELAYMHFAEADITEHFEVPGPFEGTSFPLTHRTSLKVTGPAVSLLGILPLGAGFEAYLRGGVFFADQENELRFASASETTTFGSEEWLAGAGIQWTFAKRWGLRLEYQRIDSMDDNRATGEVELDQLSLSGTFAL
jgi:hypothetical protein